MKYFYVTLALIGISYGAFAAFIDTSDSKRLSVSEALKESNGTSVLMEGKIQKHLHKDKYQFSDASGQMVVDIKSNRFSNIDVSSEDTVRLVGKISRGTSNIEINVSRVLLVK